MKKIFYFIASAIVALGAMACQNEVDENITPENTNEISFTVSFDESTRVEGTVEGKTASFEIDGSEILTIGEAELSYDEEKEVFVATSDEDKAILNGLIGKPVTATIKDVQNSLKFASAEFKLAQENNITVSLACPALYFTVPAGTEVALTVNDEMIATYVEGDYFLGIEGPTAKISYSIDEVKAKETTLEKMTNKVYNLGELSPRLLYLVPNDNWKVNNARFAAYFFGNGDKWVDMTESVVKGTYTVNVPAGYPNVIFCRMDPNNKTNDWDARWNQTANLENFTVGDTYHMIGWGVGAWSADYETVKAAYDTQKADYMTKVYLKPNANWKQANARFAAYTWDGNGNTWVDLKKVTDDLYYIEESALKANVIFCRMDPNNKTNDWNNGSKWNQTVDLALPNDMNRAYTISEGAWDKGDGEWSDIFESTIFNL